MSAVSTIVSPFSAVPARVGPGARDLAAGSARRLLQVPLAVKLIGANLALVVGALIVAVMLQRAGASSGSVVSAFAVALGVGTAVNTGLTWLALRPIREIRATVTRIGRGDDDARIAPSPIADADLQHIGHVVNALLDELDQERVNMHRLAGGIINADDSERDRISRVLRESIAQSLAAVTYQLAAVLTGVTDPGLVQRLVEVRLLVRQVLDDIDELSHSVHPRVLSDLGLHAGLRRLAHDLSDSRVQVTVRMVGGSDAGLRAIGAYAEAGLYAIAQAAVQNALRHASANRVRVDIGFVAGAVTLSITDDGKGFDVDAAERRRSGTGLLRMHERASMIGATIAVESQFQFGTTVRVALPAGAAPFPHH